MKTSYLVIGIFFLVVSSIFSFVSQAQVAAYSYAQDRINQGYGPPSKYSHYGMFMDEKNTEKAPESPQIYGFYRKKK